MMPKAEHIQAALRAIADMDDPDQLKRMMQNAKSKGIEEVEQAAFERLITVLPEEEPGSFEHDFWRTIHTFEELLRQERGKTIRLARTRQKIARVGIRKVLEDFATHPTSTDGYDMLIERGLPGLTGEAVILRHRHHFSEDIVEAARARLLASSVNVDEVLAEEAPNG